ncbi:hypothetical protein Scep_023983 [Stephania cephalantha]|uniref:Uncharacterized protein n=1 Tax=Stephania cephalantha TaxID=152367 RepID=A0AAP0F2T1_9MAGN
MLEKHALNSLYGFGSLFGAANLLANRTLMIGGMIWVVEMDEKRGDGSVGVRGTNSILITQHPHIRSDQGSFGGVEFNWWNLKLGLVELVHRGFTMKTS